MHTQLDKFTSTGIKFWAHPAQMMAYRNGEPQTVISTHISPEGACNLACSYCSVQDRDQSQSLRLGDAIRYVDTLRRHGLKAVILTGGGEPTAYPGFNILVRYLRDAGLKIGLITNGTLAYRVDDWDAFAWVRVSINRFPGWRERINLPRLDCTVGASFIYTADGADLDDVAAVADRIGAEYIRVLPDCRLKDLDAWHKKIAAVFDSRFMHQRKLHEAPRYGVCHQSYFRPYLHESGYVFPCDSVVLNRSAGKFPDKYRLCHWSDVGSYLEKKIHPTFDPRRDCPGCVFTKTVNMLGDWHDWNIEHADFV
jgi:hypothetical protein